MDKELKQIIAQETIKLIVEQSKDPAQVCLDDLKQIKILYNKICRLMNNQFNKKIRKLEKANNSAQEAPNTVSTRAASAPAQREIMHTVKQGDTFWGLAKRYLGRGTRWKEILSNNSAALSGRRTMPAKGIIPGAKGTDEPIPIIIPGDKLRIPAK